VEEARRKELAAAGKPNPICPIDKETKEALKDQVEKTIAEKKVFGRGIRERRQPGPAGCFQVVSPDPNTSFQSPRLSALPVQGMEKALAHDRKAPAESLRRPGKGVERCLAEHFVT